MPWVQVPIFLYCGKKICTKFWTTGRHQSLFRQAEAVARSCVSVGYRTVSIVKVDPSGPALYFFIHFHTSFCLPWLGLARCQERQGLFEILKGEMKFWKVKLVLQH